MEKSCKWFLRTRFNNNLIILTTSFKSSEDILIHLNKKHEATELNFKFSSEESFNVLEFIIIILFWRRPKAKNMVTLTHSGEGMSLEISGIGLNPIEEAHKD